MAVEEVSFELNERECEALMWGFAQIGDHIYKPTEDKADPRWILLSVGYTREAIAGACEEMFSIAYRSTLRGPFTSLEADILRLSIENSSWLWHYQRHTPGATAAIMEGRAALRSLAAKLEQLGIEVNRLPED